MILFRHLLSRQYIVKTSSGKFLIQTAEPQEEIVQNKNVDYANEEEANKKLKEEKIYKPVFECNSGTIEFSSGNILKCEDGTQKKVDCKNKSIYKSKVYCCPECPPVDLPEDIKKSCFPFCKTDHDFDSETESVDNDSASTLQRIQSKLSEVKFKDSKFEKEKKQVEDDSANKLQKIRSKLSEIEKKGPILKQQKEKSTSTVTRTLPQPTPELKMSALEIKDRNFGPSFGPLKVVKQKERKRKKTVFKILPPPVKFHVPDNEDHNGNFGVLSPENTTQNPSVITITPEPLKPIEPLRFTDPLIEKRKPPIAHRGPDLVSEYDCISSDDCDPDEYCSKERSCKIKGISEVGRRPDDKLRSPAKPSHDEDAVQRRMRKLLHELKIKQKL